MKVLIIEDDREIVEVVSLAFKIRWPEVKLVSTHLGERGVELVESENPDVIILDLGLVDISGFEVLQQIRLFSAIPILILTVRSDEADIVKGLEWGADDYMVKPFRQLELLSRIRALTRRASPAAKETLLVCGQLRFDPSTRQLFYGDREIGLTRSEASILQHLMRNAGQVVTYSSLAEAVWGEDYPDATESLRVYIRRLREKLETEPGRPQIILTKTGVGYSLVKPG
ncbi:MAG: response regulator transcription factor [Chloroflexi bacterium]|nr:response regulator transcription factor [Chloroflexota bacterium]